MREYLKIYLQQELEKAHEFLVKEMEVNYKVTLNDNVFNHIGPMFLLTFSRSHRKKNTACILASATYFILLSNDIHQQNQSINALNILLGDFFYTKFYSCLCKYDLLNWANDFSNIICQLQDAAITRSQKDFKSLSPINLVELADKEYANICELCCFIGGSLIGFNENKLAMLKRFGKNVGRSIYFTDLFINKELAISCLLQANKYLTSISNFMPQEIIFNLLNHLKSILYKLKVDKAV